MCKTDGDAAAGEDLSALFEDVWQRLVRGASDRHSSARHPVLATVGQDGGAEARIVVLRGADRAKAELTMHSDAASEKVAEVHAMPRATLLVWDAQAQLQLRLRAEVRARAGHAGEWAEIPPNARRVYGGTPRPGSVIPSPDAHDPAPDPARFRVLEAALSEIETLHLGRDLHRRALFRRDDGWVGQWLAP